MSSKVIPTSTDKALKYYPAEDVAEPRKVQNHHHIGGGRNRRIGGMDVLWVEQYGSESAC
jgi:hypothetical protein